MPVRLRREEVARLHGGTSLQKGANCFLCCLDTWRRYDGAKKRRNGRLFLSDTPWWKSGIIYQIYPRSFQDSNGDGVGDLSGIIGRLDYLAWIGIDAIWISPIYPSPMADFGYDVSEYCNIDPLFGTLDDFDRLLRSAHNLGLKVILDFVPNHTSNEHPWFKESRNSRSNDKRDWYIWRDPTPLGSPPNNWMSQFGGPAWAKDSITGQYYLHSFLREQPDLNWRNPEVQEAMFDVLRFWLDRGVDGFRVDVIWLLIKDDQLRDNPPNPAYLPTQLDINRTLSVYNSDRPEIHALIAKMRAVVDEYGDRVLIGEIYLPIERLVTYYGEKLSGAHLPFNFSLIHTAWNANAISSLVLEYEKRLPPGGWPNWVLGNHDQPRIASRVGPAQARIAAMLLLTLRGTPTMYYGDEAGMARIDVRRELVQDPWEMNEPGLGVGRDPWRTPMQWDASANAGFTTGRPWLPVDPDYTARNIAVLRKDPQSILALYRELIAIRRASSALVAGRARAISAENNVLVYERADPNQLVTVALNFGDDPRQLPTHLVQGRILLSTYMDHACLVAPLQLRANEGLIVVETPN
jgi:alpha-glucosidase